jgi:hypothetical protein
LGKGIADAVYEGVYSLFGGLMLGAADFVVVRRDGVCGSGYV